MDLSFFNLAEARHTKGLLFVCMVHKLVDGVVALHTNRTNGSITQKRLKFQVDKKFPQKIIKLSVKRAYRNCYYLFFDLLSIVFSALLKL